MKKSILFTCLFSLFAGIGQLSADVLYMEDFNDAAIDQKGNDGGVIDMAGVTNFSINTTAANIVGGDWFKVNGGLMEARDVDGDCILEIPLIDLSLYSNASINITASELGGLEDNDYLVLSYALDGGAYTVVADWMGMGDATHTLINDFTAASVYVSNINASTLSVRLTMRTSSGTEYIQADDILIEATPATLPTNIPPILASIPNQSVTDDNNLRFGIYATPTDGDPVSLSMSNAPAGAVLYVTNNAATFEWANASPTGVYNVTFYASDNDGADSQAITITVNPKLSAFKVMAANLSSQTAPCTTHITDPAERIFVGLDPDIVAMQEWNVTNALGYREFVDLNFGTNFDYYVEPPDPSCPMPNGIISRWPIVDSGYWNDPEVFNRDFAWATISVPGANPLHVISVHLKAGSTGGDIATRELQAQALTNLIAQNFSSTNFIVLAGDFNLQSRSESTLAILTNAFSDGHKPKDQNGVEETNIPRDKPYDLVLPNFTLDANHIPLTISPHNFNDGMVFDSREWATPPSPILAGDSAEVGIQHLAVMKQFNFTYIDQPPILESIGSKALLISNALSFAVNAVPTESDPVTLSASGLPPGASFNSVGENGNFTWTVAAPAGVYTTTFYAVDVNGTNLETIIISVLEQPSLIISEVADPIDNIAGRFVEIYNTGSTPIDLGGGQFHLSRQLNGQIGSWYDLALTGTIAQGEAFAIGIDVTNFPVIYGIDPYMVDEDVPNGNGDDTYALFVAGDYQDGALVDIFGEIDVDGSSEDWYYADDRAVRNDNIVVPNTTWTSSEWTWASSATTAEMSPGYHGSNAPPILNGIGSRSTFLNGLIEFGVSATPTTADPVTLSVSNAPAGFVFATTNENGVFTWNPASPVGVYTMTFYAVDEDGMDSETITITVGSPPPDLIISEVADPLNNTTGRFVEIYNPNGFAIDFSVNTYFLGRQVNGGASWDEVQLTGTVAAGSTYVAANSQATFFDMYGVNADIDLPGTSGNGDDGYFLFAFGDHSSGALLDSFGKVNTDGSGQAWEYTDSRAVRNSNIIQPSPVWTASEWTFTGSANDTDMGPGVHSTPSGQPPTLSDVDNSFVERSNNLSFTVSAFDQVDGDEISLYATDLPPGATFASNSAFGGITGTFNWVSAAPAGVYTTTFWAVDGDGTVTDTVLITVTLPIPPGTPWINEFHYDNTGTDVDEGFEIAGPAGFNLAGFNVHEIEGTASTSSGQIDSTVSLSGVIPDEGCGYGAIWFAFPSMENAPEGLALEDASSNLVQFFSYEGNITGTEAPVLGVDAVLLPVSEPTSTPVGETLQLTGTGTNFPDFTWTGPTLNTRGLLNGGQSVPGCSLTNLAVTLVPIGDKGVTVNLALNFTVIAYEGDGDEIGLWAENLPAGATFAPVTNAGGVTNTFDWNPATPVGVYTSTFWAADKDSTNSETILITVSNETPPNLNTIGPQSTIDLTPLVFGVSATPTDGDAVTLTASNLPGDAAFYPTNEFATFDWPTPTPVGMYTIEVWAADNDGANFESVVITVNPPPPNQTNVWINELHYDNVGTDVDEGLEIAGLAGTVLDTFQVLRYEGSGTSSGRFDGTISLTGVIDDEGCGYGAIWRAYTLENGPDALALVDENTNLIEFISYISSVTATDGPLVGLTSSLMPTSEVASAIGDSLQLTGTGTNSADFTWTGPTATSMGDLNAGQFISGCVPTNNPPVITSPGNQTVIDGQNLSFSVLARDTIDKDVITLYATDLPAGATFPSNSLAEGITNAFSWNPATPDGVYTTTFWAIDKDGTSSVPVEITVQPAPPALIISEVADPGDGTSARFVEVYNPGTVAIDFSTIPFYLGRQSNGGATWDEIQLTGTLAAGTAFVAANDAAVFLATYGFDADFELGSSSFGNGDDAVALHAYGDHTSGSLVDIYGALGVDGTGQPWEYVDSQALRINAVTNGNTTWTSSEWTIVSANVADMTPGAHGPNQPPTLQPIGSKLSLENASLVFDVTALDLTDGDTVTLWAENLPVGATFPSNSAAGGITSSFNWASATPIGVYTTTFWAADKDGSASEDVVFTVVDRPFDLIISEVADPGDNLQGRFVEIYNPGSNTVDFSTNVYYIARQVNGGGTWEEIMLTGSLAAGDSYVIANTHTGFLAAFGFSADAEFVAANGNGDDAYILYAFGDHTTGAVLDIYGQVDVDGTGQTWEYTDAQATRNLGVTAPNATWTLAEWTITAADVAAMTPGAHGPNQPPAISPVGSKAVIDGNSLVFDVTALDLVDGDTVTLWAENLPAGAAFPSNTAVGGLTSSFNWASATPIGVYTTTFYAADKDGIDSEAVVINVQAAPPALLISEVADTADTSLGRFVELWNPGVSAIDFAVNTFYVSRQLNGGASWDEVMLTGTVAAGGTYVIANNASNFLALYGFSPDIEIPGTTGNGNDSYVLFTGGDHLSGAIVDIYGEIGIDGTGQAWDYTDAQAQRIGTVTQPNATWTALEWIISSNAPALDMTPGIHGTNMPPVLNGIGNSSIMESNALAFGVSANVTDGDTVTLSVSNAPAGSVFATTNENGTFSWDPATPVGVYTMTFWAVDKDGADSETIELTVTPISDIVIAEILFDPVASEDTVGEWIELYNNSGSDIDINGWTLTDNGSDLHVITNGGPLLVPAKGFLVLGKSSDTATNGNVAIDYQYDSFTLGNATDSVVLLDVSLAEVTRVDYDDGTTFPDPAGASIYLVSPDVFPNDGANWAISTLPWPGSWGDLGSPGSANEQGVWGTNVPPVLGAIGSQAVFENDLVTFGVSATPSDGDTVTLTVSNAPAGHTFATTNENGTFSWTATPIGVYTMTFYAADKDGVDTETITITVSSNSPPTLSAIGDRAVVVGHLLEIGIFAGATEGDPVTITASNLPAGAVFSSSNTLGFVSWTNANPIGVYTSSFHAEDDDGTVSETITISVIPKPLATNSLAFYDFNDTLNVFEVAPDTVLSGLSAADFDTDNSVYSETAGLTGRAINDDSWTNSTSYYEFSVTLTNGTSFDVDGFSFFDRRSTTGPTNWYLRYSGDAYASDLCSGNANTDISIGNSCALALPGLTGTVTFRIYADGASAGSGTWRLDDVQLTGFVNAGGTPGDTDGDGMPDQWETDNGLNPGDPGDATGDADSDGMSNLAEFIANTNPQDNTSLLVFTVEDLAIGSVNKILEWQSGSNRLFTIVFSRNAVTEPYTNVLVDGLASDPPLNTFTDLVNGAETELFYQLKVRLP